ncbi:hypothetical protein KR009_005347 [Drosophila setifemur]|nr:hypothetical protein KR009_005347 [Drosophila setifemur]
MPPKRRRRFQGLYYHSSPPKVMPMNGQAGGQNGRKRRDNDDFSVKLSTIRIWMHEKDIGKLTRILWAGQGNRLSQQASNNGRVKRFLAAVPHVMVSPSIHPPIQFTPTYYFPYPKKNAIKDLHQAVIDNNLESVQAQLEPPVPSALVTCKDGNGLNVIHKAAGLGHTKILEYLVGIWPEGAHEMDITGKTPLHWAASAKNNMRCYTLLTQAGCDEEAVDYKMKTPSYYRHKPHEIERAFLVFVPDAPRVSPESVTDWEALSDDSVGDNGAGGDASSKVGIRRDYPSRQFPHTPSFRIPPQKLDMKPLPTVNGRKSVDDSLENTSELDTNDGTSANDDDDLSKADAEPEQEPEEPASPLQRRPETPATFNTLNGDGDDSEAENIARAVSEEVGGDGEGDGEAEENGVEQGGGAAVLENGREHEEEQDQEEEEQPAEVREEQEEEEQKPPEESANESELEEIKKTEEDPQEPEGEAAEEVPEEPENTQENGGGEPEVAEIENDNDNDDDDDDEVQMGVL